VKRFRVKQRLPPGPWGLQSALVEYFDDNTSPQVEPPHLVEQLVEVLSCFSCYPRTCATR
jgi:hypothetical protein